jgi:hypothetical protein
MKTCRVGVLVCVVVGLAGTTRVATADDLTAALAGTDHYMCYATRGSQFAPRTVGLVDQFVGTTATVVRPLRFCNPANKNGEGIVDPTANLMCYRLTEPHFTRRTVLVRNQFGDQTLTVIRPESLCNPAEKNGVPSQLNINHYKCYRVKAPRPAPIVVNVVDDFDSGDVRVLSPHSLCNPVDKNGEGIVDPAAHLVCYTIGSTSSFRATPIGVADQFGAQNVTMLPGRCSNRAILCVPSEKNPGTTTTTTATTSTTTTTSSTITTTTTTATTTTDTTTTTTATTTTTTGTTQTTTTTTTTGTTDTSTTTLTTTTTTDTTTTDTSPEDTTTTTEPRVAICGNDEVEPGEDCDPPSSACQCPPDPPGFPSGTCDDFCTCFCMS